MQEELVRMVAEKTGLPEDKARQAADTVIGYLKQHLPGPVAGQLDNIGGSGTSGNPGLTDAAKSMGGKLMGNQS